MSYSIEKLTNVLCVLDPLPSDIKQLIWQTVIELEKNDTICKGPPPIKKMHKLSKRTTNMMHRWYRRGSKIRHGLDFN